MTNIKVEITDAEGIIRYEDLNEYCLRLSKKNNSTLYLLESYLGMMMSDDEELEEIRRLILTVSANILRLNTVLYVENGDSYERL